MSTNEEKVTFDTLVGRRIDRISLSDAEQRSSVGTSVVSYSILNFDTDRGRVSYQTESDCCSETWFADICGVAALLGATVRKVEAIEAHDAPEGDKRSRQESDIIYGVKITTDRGQCDVIYRNSSNGYYGGSCSRMRVPYAGDALPVSVDWSA